MITCDDVVTDPRSLPSVAVATADGYTISVQGGRPCFGTGTLTAAEQADRVTLTMMHTEPVHHPPCTVAVALGTWHVRLGKPLGQRSLLDGCTGQPEPVSFSTSNAPLTTPNMTGDWWLPGGPCITR